ncbi:MAG TPA: hypothetical protein RMH99_03340 [Sandaracinaceae bacterium LLY-WYZ-13_1]|nr:hypothetical protein [Sandaracinaceae bacterium LLY-WYZ-13_1]
MTRTTQIAGRVAALLVCAGCTAPVGRHAAPLELESNVTVITRSADDTGEGEVTVAAPSLATVNYLRAVLDAMRREALERGYCLDEIDPTEGGPIYLTSDGIIGSVRGRQCEEPDPEDEVAPLPEGDIDPHPDDPGPYDLYERCEVDEQQVTGACELVALDPCGSNPEEEEAGLCVPVDPREIYVLQPYEVARDCPQGAEGVPEGLCGIRLEPIDGAIDPHPDTEPVPVDCSEDQAFCEHRVDVFVDCHEYPQLCELEVELLETPPVWNGDAGGCEDPGARAVCEWECEADYEVCEQAWGCEATHPDGSETCQGYRAACDLATRECDLRCFVHHCTGS